MRLLVILGLLLIVFLPCVLCIFVGGTIRFFGLIALFVWVYAGYTIMVELLYYRDRNNDEEST